MADGLVQAAAVLVSRELIEARLRATHGEHHDDHAHEHYRGARQAEDHAVTPTSAVIHRADDSTVAAHRDANTNGYAAKVATLLLALKAGKVGLQDLNASAGDAWQEHLDAAAQHIGKTHDVPAERLLSSAAIPLATLGAKAAVRVLAMGERITHPKLKTPTDPQIRAAGNQAAGNLWGSHYALEAKAYAIKEQDRGGVYTGPLIHIDSFDRDTGEPIGKTYRRERIRARWDTAEDDRVCIECELREGETYDVDNIPYLPGGGGTSCEGACRCDLIFYTAQGQGYDVPEPKARAPRAPRGPRETVADLAQQARQGLEAAFEAGAKGATRLAELDAKLGSPS